MLAARLEPALRIARGLPLLARLGLGVAFAVLAWALHLPLAAYLGSLTVCLFLLPATVLAAIFLGFHAGVAAALGGTGLLVISGVGEVTAAQQVIIAALFAGAGLVVSAAGAMARRCCEATRALGDLQARSEGIFNSMSDGFCTLEVIFDDRARLPDGTPRVLDFRFVETNPAFDQHTGFVNARGRTARQMVPDLDDFCFNTYGEVVLTGRTMRFENHVPALGRWFEVCASRIDPPEMRLVAVIFRDITRRKEAQEALRHGEERYRAIVEGQSEMVCRFRRDGTLLFVNGAYARSRGTTPEALVGVNFWDWISPEDRPSVEAMLDSLTPLAPDVRIENRFETVAGVRWTLWNNRALAFDAHGRATEFQSAGMDITDRKTAEQALEQANADLLRFASAASHDLKEPLRGISRLASFIASDEPSLSVESRQRLDRIRVLCERLTGMVSGLLEHAQTGIEPRREPCDLNKVVRRVVDTSAEDLSARQCEVILRGTLPTVRADPALMERVFANLISNAVKFNESPVRRVEISAKGSSVAVRDNGIGIDARHQGAIFRIFRRIHSQERYGGAGLGLSLVKRIIEAHGASIDVESAPGKGTTFWLRLGALSPEGARDGDAVTLVSPSAPAEQARAAATDHPP